MIDRGIAQNFSIGKSAIIDKGVFCSIRFNALEGYLQGHGATVEEAFADTMRQAPAQHQTRPVTTTFQMPEPGKIRMPL
jgi:hypothetical protein